MSESNPRLRGIEDDRCRADDVQMRCSPWAKPLALVSLALPAAGAVLVLRSAGSLTGLVLIGAGAPVAFAGWLALGRPVRHRRATRA